MGSANIVSARYSANLCQTRIESNGLPRQQAHIVITNSYLCAASSWFDSLWANSLLTGILRDFFSVSAVNSSIRSRRLTNEGVTSM